MYQEYWKLKEKPFQNTPDPRFLYYSAQHEETLLKLIYAVKERLGAAVLTGVFGCGKTLIAQALLHELSHEQYKVAFITNPRLDEIELLRMIIYSLGNSEVPLRKADILNLLKSILINNIMNGKQTVVIIDEAHTISDDNVFEEIRMLLNLQLEDTFLLTILLIGQPELKDKINRNAPLEQRVNVKSHLGSLTLEETRKYINHRFTVAGCSEPIFSDQAISAVYNYSAGIPRRINRLCDMCLLAGFAKKIEHIDENIVQEEIRGLD